MQRKKWRKDSCCQSGWIFGVLLHFSLHLWCVFYTYLLVSFLDSPFNLRFTFLPYWDGFDYHLRGVSTFTWYQLGVCPHDFLSIFTCSTLLHQNSHSQKGIKRRIWKLFSCFGKAAYSLCNVFFQALCLQTCYELFGYCDNLLF